MSKEESNTNLVFRQASEDDIPFLIDTIVAAEKSGTELLSYSTLFEMPEAEVRKIFSEILKEDITGQELCISNYLVAEWEGQRAGAVAAWIEGPGNRRSSLIKATLLQHFFPEENMKKAREKKKYIEQMHFDPQPGSLVIDIGLTLPAFRGKGILQKLMEEQTRLYLKKNPELSISHIHVMKSNTVAFHIYSRMGYYVIEEKRCVDPVILSWLPSDTQIVMERIFAR